MNKMKVLKYSALIVLLGGCLFYLHLFKLNSQYATFLSSHLEYYLEEKNTITNKPTKLLQYFQQSYFLRHQDLMKFFKEKIELIENALQKSIFITDNELQQFYQHSLVTYDYEALWTNPETGAHAIIDPDLNVKDFYQMFQDDFAKVSYDISFITLEQIKFREALEDKISDLEVSNYYQQNKNLYQTELQKDMTVFMINLDNRTLAEEQAARVALEDLYQKLQQVNHEDDLVAVVRYFKHKYQQFSYYSHYRANHALEGLPTPVLQLTTNNTPFAIQQRENIIFTGFYHQDVMPSVLTLQEVKDSIKEKLVHQLYGKIYDKAHADIIKTMYKPLTHSIEVTKKYQGVNLHSYEKLTVQQICDTIPARYNQGCYHQLEQAIEEGTTLYLNGLNLYIIQAKQHRQIPELQEIQDVVAKNMQQAAQEQEEERIIAAVQQEWQTSNNSTDIANKYKLTLTKHQEMRIDLGRTDKDHLNSKDVFFVPQNLVSDYGFVLPSIVFKTHPDGFVKTGIYKVTKCATDDDYNTIKDEPYKVQYMKYGLAAEFHEIEKYTILA